MSRLVFGVLLAALVLLALADRTAQLHQWRTDATRHYAGSVPVASTDSFLWFRMAREVREAAVSSEVDALRWYPGGRPETPVPAISRLMALLATPLGGDVYRAGQWLTIVLATAFLLPLALYGWRLGLPAVGLVAGLVTAFSVAYAHRTSIARVDTDGGNLFFVCLLAFTIGSLSRETPPRRALAWSALAGLGVAAFCRWYLQPGFWLVYVLTFLLHLAVAGPREHRLRLAFLFLALSNPWNAPPALSSMVEFLRDYVAAAPAGFSPLDYTRITRTIHELLPLAPTATLRYVVDVPGVSVLGLIGFAALIARLPRSALGLLPLLALAGLSFVSGRRFVMYLAPVVGLGLGYGLTLAGRAIAGRMRPASGHAFGDILAIAAAVVAFAISAAAGRTALGQVPEPTVVTAPLLASLQNLRARLPDGAAILGSWSFGYLVTDQTGAATFDDGEKPDPLFQYLYYRAVTSTDPDETIRILHYLATHGRPEREQLFASQEPLDALREIARSDSRAHGEVVLLFTERTLGELSLYFHDGQWDFVENAGPGQGVLSRRCRYTGEETLVCMEPEMKPLSIDLGFGLLNGAAQLRRSVVVRNGEIVREVAYEHPANVVAQVLEAEDGRDGPVTVQLILPPVFESAINRMFMLGRYDKAVYEEIWNDFPTSRAYRLR